MDKQNFRKLVKIIVEGVINEMEDFPSTSVTSYNSDVVDFPSTNIIPSDSDVTSSDNDIENKTFKRKCPRCGKDLFHTTKYHRDRAERNRSVCKDCGHKNAIVDKPTDLTRKCPQCEKDMTYSSYQSFKYANKYGIICKACSIKNRTGMKQPQRMIPKKVGFASKLDYKNRNV
jgi:transposase-like protein